MIYLNPHTDKIISARKHHVEELKKLLSNRVRRLKLSNRLIEFLQQDILVIAEEILGALPQQLVQLHASFEFDNFQKNAIKKLFNYSDWFCKKDDRRYNAYDLASKLDVNTCVYCNRNYTSTVAGIIRPQFDHYFAKDRYPLLALSFYNLIPSCSICNSQIKGKRELSLIEHLHPYLDNHIKDFRFSYSYNSKEKHGISINIKHSTENSKAKNTFEFFKTEKIYNAHIDELKELIKIRETFSDKYLEILSSQILVGTEIGRSELYQLAFGVHAEEDKVCLRPFSKFKKDILTELGIFK